MKEINANIYNFFSKYFSIDKMNTFFSMFLKITIPIFIIYMIIFTISLFKIFKKEEINPWFCLIPVYRFYLYYKIVKLPFILYFIPVVNLIMFIVSPYRLAHQYKCNDFLKAISIFVPFIVVPYIAFSNLQNRDKKIETKYIKSEKDLDMLEEQLKSEKEGLYIEDDSEYLNIAPKQQPEGKTDTFIDSLTYSNNTDEFVEDEDLQKDYAPKEEVKETKYEDFDEIEDEENIDGININNLDAIEDKIMSNYKTDNGSQEEKQDYEVEQKKELDLAFGGSEEKAKVQVQSKDTKKTCPRCNASLIGARDICPGCGANLKELFK